MACASLAATGATIAAASLSWSRHWVGSSRSPSFWTAKWPSLTEGPISRFEWLRAKPKDEPATLPVYIAFDILELAGRDVRDRPLKQRRRMLERLVWHHSMIFPARRLADDGLKAWQEAMARGYEGIVAKDPESRYVPGRTLKWLKVKQKDYRVEERGFYDPGRR